MTDQDRIAALPAGLDDLREVVASAIEGVEIISRFNDWTRDRVVGFPIEIIDVSGQTVAGEGRIISRHRADEDETACRDAALRKARADAAISAILAVGYSIVPSARTGKSDIDDEAG